jgi:hypothetical protein
MPATPFVQRTKSNSRHGDPDPLQGLLMPWQLMDLRNSILLDTTALRAFDEEEDDHADSDADISF